MCPKKIERAVGAAPVPDSNPLSTTESTEVSRRCHRDITVLRVLRVSYENTFSAVAFSPYLHLLPLLDRRKHIFIRYGEPQAHGNSVVKENVWIFTWKLPASTEKLCARIRSGFNL